MTTINFNKRIYNLKAIKEAIKAYKGLAKFNICSNKKYITVNLTNMAGEYVNIIEDEFGNYVLSLMRTW